MSMAAKRSKPLLAAGNEAEWAEINRVEAQQDAAFARRLSLNERLELGQRLCDEAFEVLNAFRPIRGTRAGDPRA